MAEDSPELTRWLSDIERIKRERKGRKEIYRFPTVELKDEFVRSLRRRSDDDVRNVLEALLVDPPREGLAWVAQLLPDSPGIALVVLEAYYQARMWNLSDVVILTLSDAEEIIRAKYPSSAKGRAAADDPTPPPSANRLR